MFNILVDGILETNVEGEDVFPNLEEVVQIGLHDDDLYIIALAAIRKSIEETGSFSFTSYGDTDTVITIAPAKD